MNKSLLNQYKSPQTNSYIPTPAHAGWNAHSVEFLGMLDKETLGNLTKTFERTEW